MMLSSVATYFKIEINQNIDNGIVHEFAILDGWTGCFDLKTFAYLAMFIEMKLAELCKFVVARSRCNILILEVNVCGCRFA